MSMLNEERNANILNADKEIINYLNDLNIERDSTKLKDLTSSLVNERKMSFSELLPSASLSLITASFDTLNKADLTPEKTNEIKTILNNCGDYTASANDKSLEFSLSCFDRDGRDLISSVILYESYNMNELLANLRNVGDKTLELYDSQIKGIGKILEVELDNFSDKFELTANRMKSTDTAAKVFFNTLDITLDTYKKLLNDVNVKGIMPSDDISPFTELSNKIYEVFRDKVIPTIFKTYNNSEMENISSCSDIFWKTLDISDDKRKELDKLLENCVEGS